MLRDAYDGSIAKEFGTGSKSFVSKFGIITGVTPAIEVYTENATALGERFLKFNIPIPKDAINQLEYLVKAEANAGKEVEMREALLDIATKVLSHDFTQETVIPESIKRNLMFLAQFVARTRAKVERDRFTREVVFLPQPELGTRLVKQFSKLIRGIGKFRGEEYVSAHTYNIVSNLALATIPSRLNTILRFMYKKGMHKTHTLTEIRTSLKVATRTLERLLDDWTLLDMIDVKENTKSMLERKVYKLSKDAHYLISNGKLYG